MNKYELALVVSAKVEDEVRDAVVEKAKGYITRYNGVITDVEEWGKKKLAYEIQKMHEGFYYFIQFEADAQCPAEVERHIRIMDNVLRFLVVSAKVEDEVRDAVVEKAKGYITRYNGTITEVEEWGKKKLAYEIQKMHEGFYYFIQFEADAQCPAEVERHVRIMDNVLRYLVVRKDA